MNLYYELHMKQQKEINAFPIMFAFSNKQFDEGMQSLGLKPTDTNKIYSIGGGGYIRKTDAKKLDDLLKKHKQEMQKAIDEDDGTGFIKDMFSYELDNHEYGYTRDLSDTLDSLDLTIDEINKDKKLRKGLQLALKRYKNI